MTPEQKARVSIDALLAAASWHVCNGMDASIHASTSVAIGTRLQALSVSRPPLTEVGGRQSIFREVEVEIDATLPRA